MTEVTHVPETVSPYRPPTLGGGSSRINWLSALAGFAVGLVLASLAWVQVLPDERAGSGEGGELTYVPPGDLPPGVEADGQGSSEVLRRGGLGETQGQAGTKGTTGTEGEGGNNNRPDDQGVTGNLVKLGATVAEDGIARSFLGEVRYGMEAVKSRVNRVGGIKGTGRQLAITYKQDAWDPTRGRAFIENLIKEQKVFALAVSPSSEGLNAASEAGLFKTYKVPVVGADGLNNTQFLDPWIWPVAAATTTQAHVIMKDACTRAGGSKCSNLRPAIVFGNTYRFGVEGAFAFNGAYCRLQGGTVAGSGRCSGAKDIPGFSPGGTSCKSSPPEAGRFCGIDAGKQQFTSEIATVREACKARGTLPKCNFVFLLLEPSTALSWMGSFDSAKSFQYGMAGAQPLFTSNFAVECRTKCNEMRVWTGYNPPIGAYANNPKVAEYVRALKAQNSRADENNQFTMGGYIGMSLLVDALERAGKDLTVPRLVEILNSMPPLVTGLTNPSGLKWTASDRYANHSAQSFRIDYLTKFDGWQPVAPYTKDPYLGKDNKLP